MFLQAVVGYISEMTQPPVIKNLKELLEPALEPGTQVLGHQTTFLTAPGDNYGSTMLALTVDVIGATTKKVHHWWFFRDISREEKQTKKPEKRK